MSKRYTLPKGWRSITLADTASKTANSFVDGPFGSDLKTSDYTEQGVRVLQLQNLGDGVFYNAHKIYTSERKAEALARCLTFPGDVIIAKMADPLARAAIVPDLENKFLIVADLMRLRSSSAYEPHFIVAMVNSPTFRKEANRLSTGTTRTRISLSVLKKIDFPCPELPEQQEIAKNLSTLNELIKHTEEVIAKYQAIRQGLIQDLLSRGVDEQGRIRPRFEEAPDLYQESPLGWVPKQWTVVRLRDRFAVRGGKRLPAGHDYSTNQTSYRYLRVVDFFNRMIDSDSLEYLDEKTFNLLERYEILPGELYISIAGSLGSVGVFRPGSYPATRTILTENAARLCPKAECISEFVAYAMNSYSVQAQIYREIGTGGGVPKLALFRIENLMLPWPEPREQQVIVEYLATLEESISSESLHVQKLHSLKSGLMQDLLTGKVRVSVDRTSPDD